MEGRGPVDVDALRRHHDAYLRQMEQAGAQALDTIAQRMINYARATKAVQYRSGQMAAGWSKTPVVHTALGLLISFFSNVKHAFWQEFGTGLWGPTHDYIRPKRASVLRWVSGGVTHYARKVRGVPPKFIAKHAWFQAGHFDAPAIFERSLGALRF